MFQIFVKVQRGQKPADGTYIVKNQEVRTEKNWIYLPKKGHLARNYFFKTYKIIRNLVPVKLGEKIAIDDLPTKA